MHVLVAASGAMHVLRFEIALAAIQFESLLQGYARSWGATLMLRGLEIGKEVTLGRGLSVQPSGSHATADLWANLKAVLRYESSYLT